MPHPLSRRAATAAAVSLLTLSFVVLAAASGAAGSITFVSADYEVDEGAVNALIALRRGGGADGPLTAKVTLNGGTATGGVDYRMPAPGSIDSTFNIGTGPISIVRDMVEQPDGKVVIVGLFWAYNGVARNSVARLNLDGSLDTTFNPPAVTSDVFCIALQPDGRMLIGGAVSHNGNQRTGIARLNADGSPDTTFVPGLGTAGFGIERILLQPDGKILIGGNFPTYNGVERPNVARLNPDGSLDTSFNAGSGSGGGLVRELVLLPDGKILVAGGFAEFGGLPRRGAARLNADGGLDTTFNAGTALENLNIWSMARQADGKVLIGASFFTGFPSAGGGNPTPLVRLNPNGSVDNTLPDPGYGARHTINAITIQPDGKLLLGGSFTTGPAPGSVFHWLDRRNPDGSDDATFNPGLTSFSNSSLTSIIVQRDGKIVVGGQFTRDFNGNLNNVSRMEGDMFVTWDEGDSADKTVALRVLHDTLHEEDETVGLKLEALTDGATVEPLQDATLTIIDNDPLVGFPSATYSVDEDAGTLSIPVGRVGSTLGTTSFTYSAFSGTAGSADFSHTPGTVTFAPGETSKNLTFNINDDAVHERDETFSVEISSVNGGAVSRRRTDVTILNDDPLPTVSVADVTVVEGDSGTKLATFTVTRDGLTDRTVTVNVRTADGTAVAGEDYVSLGGQFVNQVQIGPAVNSSTFSVAVHGDTIAEANKTFSVELSSPVNAALARAQAVCEIQDNETSTGVPTVQLAAREFRAQEGAGVATLTVTRSGDASAPTTVGYSTALWVGVPPSGSAWDRNDYTFTSGTLRFAAGETSKTIQVFLADDALVEGDELLAVVLSAPTGGTTLGAPSTGSVRIIDNDTAPSSANPVDDTAFFVRQHYRDFLGRDPDSSGLAFWTGEIESCGTDPACREVKRVNVSAAFFLSIEFQETGYYAYLLYKAAFNTGERLQFPNYTFDTQQVGREVVVGADGWEQKLLANKQAFADSFVTRANFLAAYPLTMMPEQFVDALNNNTGDPLNPTAGGALTRAERDKLAADLTAGAVTRAQALRAVAENAEFRRRQLSKAFVLMQYFGYLRRAPNALPDTTFDGYNFWLGKLNEFGGNYINAEMVKAFIASDEYRKRFGQ